MSTSSIRCGIVGTGAFAYTHAEAISINKEFVIAGAVDTDAARRAEFAKRNGGKAHASVDALLNQEEIDIAVICAPDHTHAAIATELLRHKNAPRLVIVEKPLCTSRQQMRELETLPQGLLQKIVIDHTRRFNPGVRRIRDLIASGKLGDLQSVRWRYYAGWLHVGVHFIDLLRMFFGDMTCISAQKQGIDRFSEDPLLGVDLRSQRFPAAQIHMDGISEHPYKIFDGEFFFSAGRIRMDWNEVFIDTAGDVFAGTPRLVHAEHFTIQSPLESLQVLYASSAAFLRNGNTEIFDIAGFSQARGTMDVLFSAREAAGL